jgi:F0F1-type ATP synthase assembly protein I
MLDSLDSLDYLDSTDVAEAFDSLSDSLSDSVSFFSGIVVVFMLIGLALSIFMIVCMWKMFSKANQPGWASIIPIYNAIIFFKIGGKPWYWILFMLIPIADIVFAIMAIQSFLKAFGRGSAGSVLLLLFFPVFYYPYLAFSNDVKYVGV